MTKFAVQIENQFGYTWKDTKEIIAKTEDFGYHSFYICDHFFLDDKSETLDALEAWTVLTAAATLTKKIKLGTLVSGNNYRSPALLAKIATTLDHISAGRMELGIGAGWKKVEYEAYGFDFPSVKERLEMLEESIQVIKLLWSESRVTFTGKYYNLKDAVFSPKPYQSEPLIMIGGGGEKVTMRLVAKYADYLNLPFTPMEQIEQKLNALKGHCRDVGRDYEEIGKSYFHPIWVEDDEKSLEIYLSEVAKLRNMSVNDLKGKIFDERFPGSWIGTPEQVKERIEYMQSLGFDYFFIQQPFDRRTDGIEKFANLVMNKYFR